MFNPAKSSDNIRNEFVDYITTMYSLADKNLQHQLIEELRKSISKGPYLEIKDVFCSGKSINQLIDEGVLSPLFRQLEAEKPEDKRYKTVLPIDRPLYLHQEQAIRSIVAGNNAVISTGTGSGKTNCFLIPVINELLKEKEAGTLGPGVRAMFIYPMNALANDQMKNIRNLLMFYKDIKFGVYTGATENEEKDAIAVYEAMFATERIEELRHRLENEILSRDAMKKEPPHILFTNYAMLEHLLFRPKDDVLFSNSDFKFVVLDEAHVYTGATGIETSILLRRLQARIHATRKTQFILTSATLGSDESSIADIVSFAENLCGVPFQKESIIRSTREAHKKASFLHHYPKDLYLKLGDDENIVSSILKEFGINCDSSKPEAELLYDLISSCDLYEKMRASISEITDMNELQRVLNLDIRTAIAFVHLCTRSSKTGKSLVDARYHFFIRSLEGCYLALSPSRKLFLARQKHIMDGDKQYEVFEIAVCNNCGKIAFVGIEENRHLIQVSKLGQQVSYYYPASEKNDDIDEIEDFDLNDEGEDNITDNEYYLCPHCGAIAACDEIHNLPCDCEKEDYIKVVKAKDLKYGARCGNCHSGSYKRYYLGNDAATSVLATSLYEELPELEFDSEIMSSGTTNLFARAMAASKKNARKTGRQFIAFSDSRQEAAKFACYLKDIYDEFLRRRGITQVLKTNQQEIISSGYSLSDFVSLLTNYFASKKSFAQSNSDTSNLTVNSKKNAWVAMLNELARFNSSTSLTSLGFIQFAYKGNTPEIVKAVSEQYKVEPEVSKNLLELLAFEIVKAGAIKTDSDSDIDDNDREYVFYNPSQRFIKKLKDADDKTPSVSNWMPRSRGGNAEQYFKNNKMYYVTHSLKICEREAAEFLEAYFDYLTKPENGNPCCMIASGNGQTYVMPAKFFEVQIPGSNGAKWYRCKNCGRVSQFNIAGYCSTVRCDGAVEDINPLTIRKGNHFAELYMSDRMSPLFIKEHTAQLSKKECAEYQEQFIKKEINALSCSTTFEMGVDVGDLETVFLRDVPPLPSNYAQRAGRAGRSINAAAYALTFAKLSSHDLSFFNHPEEMIAGVILPPLFKVDNEKIARRHIYAVSLSMFFADHEDQYNHNNAEIFINRKGYESFIEWIGTKPKRLASLLNDSIPDTNGLHARLGLENFTWLDEFIGESGVFTQLIKEYESNVENFTKIVAKFKREDDLDKAARCERKMKVYQQNKLIDFLARGNILPRYGFPVNTVELEQNSSTSNISKLRLSRDLQIAIAEYAPSSEVIADGRLYTSRYIKKAQIGNNKQDWHTAYIGTCPNPSCGTMNISMTPVTKEGLVCSACGKKMTKCDFYESIEPVNGFVAERKDKDVPMTRQEKNYRSEDYYVGNVASKTIDKFTFSFGGVGVTLESTTNDSLMVKSSNYFYVCPVCGYAIAEDESIGEPSVEKEMHRGALHITRAQPHESLFGQYNCICKDFDRRTMHHVFNTDVAKMTFDCDTSDYKTMISVMYAILYTTAQELNIERRDIKACLSLKLLDRTPRYSIIIYDSVPGGAGHSRRLVTEDGRLLYSILQKAYKRMSECNCDPSCYNCLRSYDNQRIHDSLDRELAANFLEHLRGEVKVIEQQI